VAVTNGLLASAQSIFRGGWPAPRQQVLDVDILVLMAPIWLGTSLGNDAGV
jgi:hypothetical protein